MPFFTTFRYIGIVLAMPLIFNHRYSVKAVTATENTRY